MNKRKKCVYCAMETHRVFDGMLKDSRLRNRMSLLLNRMIQRNSSVINKSCDNMVEKIGAYRLINNPSWDAERSVRCLGEDCGRRIPEGRHVLCVQDTTEFNYIRKRERLSADDPDLGPLSKEKAGLGFFLHPCLVIDAEDHSPYGFSSVRIWNRSKEKGSKRSRKYQELPLEEKESYRWYETVRQTRQALPENVRKTFIGDRENDIYEVLSRIQAGGDDYLIRSVANRLTEEGKRLEELMESLPVSRVYELEIKGRHGRKARTARMELRFSRVTVHKPVNSKADVPEKLDCYCLSAREQADSVPEGEEPIDWRILTSHEVTTACQALRCVGWYKCRWLIEELFRVQKSKGMGLEDAQLESGSGLKKLAVLSLYSSYRIMLLKSAYDECLEDFQASMLFTEKEIALFTILLRMIYKKSTKSTKLRNPFKERTLPWCGWILARLAGWSGYESAHGRPGHITIRNGLEDFYQKFSLFEFWTDMNPDVYKE